MRMSVLFSFFRSPSLIALCSGGGANGEPKSVAEEVRLPDGSSHSVSRPRVQVHARESDAEGLEQLQHARGGRRAHRSM